MAIYTAAPTCSFDGVLSAINAHSRFAATTRLALKVLLISQLLVACSAALAQTSAEKFTADNWTAVTMSRSGWGAGRSRSINAAIAAAIEDCRARSFGSSDCGAEIKAIKAGWIIALRCGNYRVLTAGESLEEADEAAAHRILQLKYISNIALPSCSRILQFGPVDRLDTFERQQIGRVSRNR